MSSLTPFGTAKNQHVTGYSIFDSLDLKEEAIEKIAMSAGDGRDETMVRVEEAIKGAIGEPTLDNLFLLLTVIGMEKVNISVSEDGKSISVSGVIHLEEEDPKIKKEK